MTLDKVKNMDYDDDEDEDFDEDYDEEYDWPSISATPFYPPTILLDYSEWLFLHLFWMR